MTTVPIPDWIATAKQNETEFDDLTCWQDQIAQQSLTQDALTVVLDDGGVAYASHVSFSMQNCRLPTAVLNGAVPEVETFPDCILRLLSDLVIH